MRHSELTTTHHCHHHHHRVHLQATDRYISDGTKPRREPASRAQRNRGSARRAGARCVVSTRHIRTTGVTGTSGQREHQAHQDNGSTTSCPAKSSPPPLSPFLQAQPPRTEATKSKIKRRTRTLLEQRWQNAVAHVSAFHAVRSSGGAAAEEPEAWREGKVGDGTESRPLPQPRLLRVRLEGHKHVACALATCKQQACLQKSTRRTCKRCVRICIRAVDEGGGAAMEFFFASRRVTSASRRIFWGRGASRACAQ